MERCNAVSPDIENRHGPGASVSDFMVVEDVGVVVLVADIMKVICSRALVESAHIWTKVLDNA